VTHASLGAYAAAKNFSHGVTQNSRVFVASAVSFDPQVGARTIASPLYRLIARGDVGCTG
jgi:hypothetical protein